MLYTMFMWMLKKTRRYDTRQQKDNIVHALYDLVIIKISLATETKLCNVLQVICPKFLLLAFAGRMGYCHCSICGLLTKFIRTDEIF